MGPHGATGAGRVDGCADEQSAKEILATEPSTERARLGADRTFPPGPRPELDDDASSSAC